MEDKHKGFVLFLLVIIFGYLSFRILSPFISYLLLGLLLAFLFHPVYKRMAVKTNKTIAAVLLMVAIFVVVVVPSMWLTSNLIIQTTNAYYAAQDRGFTFSATALGEIAKGWTGLDLQEAFNAVFREGQSAFTSALPGIIQSTGEVLLGLVLVCFVLYYGLKEGDKWVTSATNAVPIKRAYKLKLRREIELATRALFFGQVLTAILIGLLCGGIFALFGISNPVFWGFLMMILAFLPLLGAPMIFIPAGIIMMANGRWVAGISIIVLCSIVVVVVDNIVRPKFVSNAAQIHPLTVIIGALGGIAFMGFVGFVMGPLILNVFMTLVTFDYDVD